MRGSPQLRGLIFQQIFTKKPGCLEFSMILSFSLSHTSLLVRRGIFDASEILFFPLQKVNTGLREDRERKLPCKTATQQQLRLQQQRPHILSLLSPVSTTTECLCSSSCFFNVSNHATDVSNLL